VNEEIKKMQATGISVEELEKVKNKTESAMAFEDMSVMNRASSIAMYELLGDADLMNSELEKYRAVTAENILEQTRIIFDDNNCSTMYYLSNN
jgi:zinc protease